MLKKKISSSTRREKQAILYKHTQYLFVVSLCHSPSLSLLHSSFYLSLYRPFQILSSSHFFFYPHQEPTSSGDHTMLINFAKRRQLSRLLQQVLAYQGVPYTKVRSKTIQRAKWGKHCAIKKTEGCVCGAHTKGCSGLLFPFLYGYIYCLSFPPIKLDFY